MVSLLLMSSPSLLLRFGGLTLVTSMFTLGGCGGDDTPGGTSTSLQAACDSFADEVCERFTGCLAPGFLDSGFDCKGTAAKSCMANYDTDESNVTAADVDACKTTYSSASCNEVTTGQPRCDFPGGNVAEGKACRHDTDCASGFCARGGNDCGTCAVPPAEGAACIQGGCGPDLTCAGGQVCRARKQAGEACTSGEDACIGALECVKGVCTAPGDVEGAACDPEGVEAPKQCNLFKALYCGAESKRCLSVTPAKAGEVCGFADGQIIGCTLSNYCKVPEGQLRGECAARLEAGAACAGDQDQCKQGLRCVGGSCADESSITCP